MPVLIAAIVAFAIQVSYSLILPVEVRNDVSSRQNLSLYPIPQADYPEWHCFDSTKHIGPITVPSDCYRAVVRIKSDQYYTRPIPYSREGGPNIRRVPIKWAFGSCMVVLDRYNGRETEDTFDLTHVWGRGSSLIRDCVLGPKYGGFGGIYNVGNGKGFFVVVVAPPTIDGRNLTAVEVRSSDINRSASTSPTLLSSTLAADNPTDNSTDNPSFQAYTPDCLTPTPHLPETNAADCRDAAFKVQNEAKSYSPVTWSQNPEKGRKVPAEWLHGSCKVVLSCFEPLEDTFSPHDVATSAIRVVHSCFRNLGTGVGGFIRIGHGKTYNVVVAALTAADEIVTLGQAKYRANTTLLPSGSAAPVLVAPGAPSGILEF
ncbi:MAG: hypothetical protein LQ351_007101 [Letrouitia transgressa]|nr:MAG: hypothetical protein LQ351_007101 [Letrouitia transgressa]